MIASNFTWKDLVEAYGDLECSSVALTSAELVNTMPKTSIKLYLMDRYIQDVEVDMMEPLHVELWLCKEIVGVVYIRVNTEFVIKLNAVLPSYAILDEFPTSEKEFFIRGKYILTSTDMEYVKMCADIYSENIVRDNDNKEQMLDRIRSYTRCTADNSKLCSYDAIGHMVEAAIEHYKEQYIKTYRGEICKTTDMNRPISIHYVNKYDRGYLLITMTACSLGLLYNLYDGHCAFKYYLDSRCDVHLLMNMDMELKDSDFKTADLWYPSDNIFPTISKDDKAIIDMWKSLDTFSVFDNVAHHDLTSLDRAATVALGLPVQVPHIEIDSITRVPDREFYYSPVAVSYMPKLSDQSKIDIIGLAGLGAFSNTKTIRIHGVKVQECYRGDGTTQEIWTDMEPGQVWIRPKGKSKPFWEHSIGNSVYHKQTIDNKLPLVNIKTKITNICKDKKLLLTPSELNVYINQVVQHGYFKFNKKHLTVIKNREDKQDDS